MDEIREDFDLLFDLLKNKKLRELREELITYNEADLAIFIEELTEMEEMGYLEALTVFRILPKDIAAETFSYFSVEVQEKIIIAMTNTELTDMVEKLYTDDVVDMLEELPTTVVNKVMENMPRDRRRIINQFLQYPEYSAGSIMTAELIDINKSSTVGQAIKKIRQKGISSESIYTIYITDSRKTLEGFVSVRTLLINKDDVKIEDLMDEDVIFLRTTDDQEYVARQFAKYGFLSLPVVDHENRLVGVVTIDDALEVLEEEATEDFEKMAAMMPSEKPYLKSSIVELAKNRFSWLIILMLTGTITGFLLMGFESKLAQISGLMAFVTMLTGAGGNAGSQSSTMIIRGLAIGELSTSDYKKVLFKEFKVSLVVGSVMAVVNFVRVLLIKPGEFMIAITVSLSLLVTIVIAKCFGGLLPILAKKLNMDPALMAAPLITTVVDTLSLVIYFVFVELILL